MKLSGPANLFKKLATLNEQQSTAILRSGVTFQQYLGLESKFHEYESEAFKGFSSLVNKTE